MSVVNSVLLSWLESHRPNTRRAYLSAWTRWTDWLGDRDPTPTQAGYYLSAMAKRRYGSNTIHLHKNAIRSCYNYLMAMDVEPNNPFRQASYLYRNAQKAQKRPTKTLTPKVIADILDDVIKDTTRKGRRNSALIYLLFGGALRRSEVIALNLGDVVPYEEKEGRHLVLTRLAVRLCHTKAGNTVMQPLPEWAADRFMRLVIERKEQGAGNNDPIFVSAGGKRMSEYTLYRIYKSILRRHGVDAAPHSARAAGATKLLSDGVGSEGVAMFLRHSTTRQVEIYDHRRKQLSDNPGRELKF